MGKLGVNAKCHCGSGKKYKKCCWMQDQERRVSPDVSKCVEFIRKELPMCPVQNITKHLTIDNYMEYQMKHLNKKTLLIAERTEQSQQFFLENGSRNSNMVVFFKDGYICYEADAFNGAKQAIKKMVLGDFDEPQCPVCGTKDKMDGSPCCGECGEICCIHCISKLIKKGETSVKCPYCEAPDGIKFT